jgi:Txe/YoeB family toxin of Txe-Axe toxin-antitoxin module
MIKRRAILAGLLATGGLIGIGFARSTDAKTIAAIVYKRLGYLRLDPEGVQRFAKDFAARQILSSTRLRTAGLLWPIYERLPQQWHDRWSNRINYAEERIVSAFLISSDFFTNGSDQAKVVTYWTYYDAVGHPCGNPFRQTVES